MSDSYWELWDTTAGNIIGTFDTWDQLQAFLATLPPDKKVSLVWSEWDAWGDDDDPDLE